MNDRLADPCTGWTAKLDPLLTRIRLHSTPRTMVALFILLTAFAPAFVALHVQLGGVTPPESMYGGYTAEQAYRALAAEGEGGRQFHLIFEGIDVFMIPVYALLYATTIAYTGQRLFGQHSRIVTWGMAIPLLAGVVDYAENAALVILLVAYPQPVSALATIAGVLTMTKWTFVCTGVLLALLGSFGLAGQRIMAVFQLRHQHRDAVRRPNLPRSPLAT